MIKEFLIKKALKTKLKGMVTDEQIDQIIAAVEKYPKFFEELMAKFQAKMAQGKSQEAAMQEIMAEQGDDMKKAFSK